MPMPRKYFTPEDKRAANKKCEDRYREENREKRRKASRDFYQRNKDNPVYKKKLAAFSKKYYDKTPKETVRIRSKIGRDKNPIRCMLADAKKRAKKRNFEYDLEVSDIFIPKVCPVLGIPLFRSDGFRTSNSPSLDRMDNLKGYTKDNTKIISHRANVLKNDATVEEMEKILEYMRQCLGMDSKTE